MKFNFRLLRQTIADSQMVSETDNRFWDDLEENIACHATGLQTFFQHALGLDSAHTIHVKFIGEEACTMQISCLAPGGETQKNSAFAAQILTLLEQDGQCKILPDDCKLEENYLLLNAKQITQLDRYLKSNRFCRREIHPPQKFIEPQADHTSSPSTQLATLLNELQQKFQNLRDRGHPVAAETAERLHSRLDKALKYYQKDHDKNKLLNTSITAIYAARPILETHRGYCLALVKIGNALLCLSLGTGCFVKYLLTRHCFFDSEKRTQSHRLLDQVKEAIEHETAPPFLDSTP